MDKNSFKQIFNGLAVSLGTLFLLLMASQLKDLRTLSTNLDQSLSKPIKLPGQIEKTYPPMNVYSGAFNLEDKGQIVIYDQNDPNKKFHYRAIIDDRLKNSGEKPILKLETAKQGNLNAWKKTDWNWIDYDQGILYFHLKTEENGETAYVDNYTGNFQLIFP